MKKTHTKTSRPTVKLTGADLSAVRGGTETISLNYTKIKVRY